MQIENKKADVRRIDFASIGVGKPFWWDDTLCIRMNEITTKTGGYKPRDGPGSNQSQLAHDPPNVCQDVESHWPYIGRFLLPAGRSSYLNLCFILILLDFYLHLSQS